MGPVILAEHTKEREEAVFLEPQIPWKMVAGTDPVVFLNFQPR
jgi:hypothetical protein